MNILHVVHGYAPSIGGSQWLVQNLSEQFVARYHDNVTVYTTVAYNMEYFWRTGLPAMPAGLETLNGVTVRRFPVFNRLNTLRKLMAGVAYRLRLPYNDWLRTLQTGPLIWGMTEAIRRSQADVVMATAFPLLHMYYAQAGAQRAGIPHVFLGALHTADVWGYDRPMIYRAIQRADAYIAYTTFERDYVTARGVAPNKIAVIGAGVDAAAFANADGAAMRQRYGWGDAPVIATLAKQTQRKRLDVLLEAMPQVWQVYPQARLALAGARGDGTPHLERLLAQLSPAQRARITVLTDLAEQDKPGLLAACDVFALPSGYESFGIAFAEAWACGKPVIGARSGAIPAVITEGQDGLLATFGDATAWAQAILDLLANPAQRTQLGAAGRALVLQNYTWDIVADRVRTVYSQAIARRANR
jgi:glycosyltransferase involved in cell wall biosynthesis